MNYLKKIACGFGVLAVLAIVPVSCISQDRADRISAGIDKSEAGVDTVLIAAGHPELVPVAHAAGGLSKWIVGLLTVGGTATGAVTKHALDRQKHARRDEADEHWDANLGDLAVMVKQLADAAHLAAPGNPHIAAQAAVARSLAERLLAAQKPLPVAAAGV